MLRVSPSHYLYIRITIVYEEKCNLKQKSSFSNLSLLFLFDFNTLTITILLRFNCTSSWQDSSHVSCDINRVCHIITASLFFKSVAFALDPVLNWPVYRNKPLTFHGFALSLSTKKLLLFLSSFS